MTHYGQPVDDSSSKASAPTRSCRWCCRVKAPLQRTPRISAPQSEKELSDRRLNRASDYVESGGGEAEVATSAQPQPGCPGSEKGSRRSPLPFAFGKPKSVPAASSSSRCDPRGAPAAAGCGTARLHGDGFKESLLRQTYSKLKIRCLLLWFSNLC